MSELSHWRIKELIAATAFYDIETKKPWASEDERMRVFALAIEKELKATRAPQQPQPAPIDIILYCPNCGKQHIDAPDENRSGFDCFNDPKPSDLLGWINPPHRSHLCHDCGCIWRPADVASNGVASVKTEGKADTWVAHDEVSAQPAKPDKLFTPKIEELTWGFSKFKEDAERILFWINRYVNGIVEGRDDDNSNPGENGRDMVNVLYDIFKKAPSIVQPAAVPSGFRLTKSDDVFQLYDKVIGDNIEVCRHDNLILHNYFSAVYVSPSPAIVNGGCVGCVTARGSSTHLTFDGLKTLCGHDVFAKTDVNFDQTSAYACALCVKHSIVAPSPAVMLSMKTWLSAKEIIEQLKNANVEHRQWILDQLNELFGDKPAVVSGEVANERDWSEDFKHENGNYSCRCSTCKESFQGHKRRMFCKLCAARPDKGNAVEVKE